MHVENSSVERQRRTASLERFVRAGALRRALASPLAALQLAIALGAFYCHAYSLSSVPRGFYRDERSIGYNAILIAQSGRDEHGQTWPLFFEAFGEYKNPLYIYLTALVVELGGYTNYAVRFSSCLCWMLGTLVFMLLGRRLWSERVLQIFSLLSLAFTPAIFCLSRVSFEVISLYPLVGLFLLAVHEAFEGRSLRWAFIAGVAIGLTTYAYTTFRLLAPLHCLLLATCYTGRRYVGRIAAFAAGAMVSVIPFVVFLSAHRDDLTRRFRELSYVYRAIPLQSKLQLFLDHYVGYFSPQYLLTAGDPNLRHHTGYGGELLLPTAVGLAIVAVCFVTDRRLRASRFAWLLLGGVLLAPVAAALTDDVHHNLRALSLFLFAVPLSVLGLQRVLAVSRHLAWAATVALAIHSGLFVHDYFDAYPAKSIAAFETYGLDQAVRKALRWTTGKVVVQDHPRAALHCEYVRTILGARRGAAVPPLVIGQSGDVQRGDSFVFLDSDKRHPALHERLPDGTLFVAVRYEDLDRIR